jgi:hypothetical protein
MVAQLRAMREQIPNFSQLTKEQSRQIIPVSAISQEMINAAANAIGESTIVEAAAGSTLEQVRQTSADANTWATLEEELAATYRGVRSANRLRRHSLGRLTLTAYAVSTALIHTPEHANLIPHVDAMRRANRFGRKRRTSAGNSQEPAPQPSPTEPAETLTN